MGAGGEVAVRLLTEKGTSKPRGCAFVEFDNAVSHNVRALSCMPLLLDRCCTVVRTCGSQCVQKALGLHLSKLEGRTINVLLSAGGGGK